MDATARVRSVNGKWPGFFGLAALLRVPRRGILRSILLLDLGADRSRGGLSLPN